MNEEKYKIFIDGSYYDNNFLLIYCIDAIR